LAKSSAAEISVADIHENLLKLRKKLFCMTGPCNFETLDGYLKMSDSLFSYQIRVVRIAHGQY